MTSFGPITAARLAPELLAVVRDAGDGSATDAAGDPNARSVGDRRGQSRRSTITGA